jgi:hypothetical protein
MIAALGLVFVALAVLYAHRQIPAYRSRRARRRGLTGTAIVAIVFGVSWAACNLAMSGPVVATSDGQAIHDLEIFATGATPGVSTGGHSNVSIFSSKIHHEAGPGILIDGGSGASMNALNIIDATDGDPGAAVQCYLSPGVVLDNVRVSSGRGVKFNACDWSSVSHLEGHDYRDTSIAAAGGLVQWIRSKHGLLWTFSNINAPGNTAIGDTVNFYKSADVHVWDGYLEGTSGHWACGVQADLRASRIWVSYVDVVGAHDGGFCAFGRYGDGAFFDHVNVRDGVCNGPDLSDTTIAFIGSDPGGPKTHVRMTNATYWNMPKGCMNTAEFEYNLPQPPSDFAERDIAPKTPFVADVCD